MKTINKIYSVVLNDLTTLKWNSGCSLLWASCWCCIIWLSSFRLVASLQCSLLLSWRERHVSPTYIEGTSLLSSKPFLSLACHPSGILHLPHSDSYNTFFLLQFFLFSPVWLQTLQSSLVQSLLPHPTFLLESKLDRGIPSPLCNPHGEAHHSTQSLNYLTYGLL